MASKAKRGRPALGHSVRVEVRLSPELAAMVARDVERLGVSEAEWFRRAALAALASPAQPREPLSSSAHAAR